MEADITALRAAYDAAQSRMLSEAEEARSGRAPLFSPTRARQNASIDVVTLVDTLDASFVRRLAAAMQVALNQDDTSNLLPWYTQLDTGWARKVVAQGSSALLDKALELITACGRSVDDSWEEV